MNLQGENRPDLRASGSSQAIGSRKGPVLLILLFGLLYLGSFYDVGFNISDEGLVVDSAVRVMDGQLVCRDFADLWTGRHQLVAGLFRLFGVDVLVFRRAMVAVRIAAAVLLFLACRRVMPTRWALGLAAITVLLSGPLHKAPLVFLYVLLLFAGIRLIERPCRSRELEAGAAIGLAAFIRFEVVLSILFCCIPVAYRLRKRVDRPSWITVAVAAAMVLLLGVGSALYFAAPCDWTTLPTWSQLTTRDGWFDVVKQRVEGTPNRPIWHVPMLLVHDLAVVLWTGATAAAEPDSTSWPVSKALVAEGIVFLFAFAALMSLRGLLWGLPDQDILMVCIGTAALVKYLVRPDFSHLLQSLPLLAAVFALAAHRVYARIWHVPGWFRRVPAAAGCLVAGLLFVTSFKAGDYYSGTIGILRQKEVRLPYPGVRVWTRSETARELDGLVSFIEDHRRPDQGVWVGPYSPMLYPILRTKNRLPYSALYLPNKLEPGFQTDQARMLPRILAEQGVVFLIEDLRSMGQAGTTRMVWPEIMAYRNRETLRVYESNSFRVFVRWRDWQAP